MRLINQSDIYTIITILLLGANHHTKGQTYCFNFQDKKELFYSSLAAWSGIKAYDILRKGEFIEELEDIDPDALWRIDRRSLQRSSSRADRLSDGTLFASISMPFLTALLDPNMRSEGANIAWMGITGYLIENSINQIFKISAERPRPYIYQQAEAVINQPISKNGTKSFFSGHASSAAYFSFFAAKVFADINPESNLRPVVWGLAALLSGTTGYLRYRAGKHFYTDVITGWIFGAGLGILIPEIFRMKHGQNKLTLSHNRLSMIIKL